MSNPYRAASSNFAGIACAQARPRDIDAMAGRHSMLTVLDWSMCVLAIDRKIQSDINLF
jgi:hypothetical protein